MRQLKHPPRTPAKRWSRVVGLLVASLIHVGFWNLAYSNVGKVKSRQPDETGVGATGSTDVGDPAATLFLINLPAVSTSQEDAPSALSPLFSAKQLTISILSTDLTPAFEPIEFPSDTDAAVTAPQVESAAVRAQQFERYSGQINARIDRAWRRPRTGLRDPREVRPPGAEPVAHEPDRFHCQVHITQTADGQVQDIALANCNGTVAWQMSLVVAIQRASPLPAPPVPSVFSNLLTLHFDSDPFGPTSDGNDFETMGEMEARLARGAGVSDHR